MRLDQSPGPASCSWDWPALRRECLGVARRLMPTASEADDVAQEALLRAWRMRRTCRLDDRRAWVRQIARNEALRSLGRRRPAVPLERIAEPARGDPAVESLAERMDVAGAIGRLPPLDRTLVALRYAHDLTQPEIADRLGIPEGTVKVRLHRARRALRDVLEGP